MQYLYNYRFILQELLSVLNTCPPGDKKSKSEYLSWIKAMMFDKKYSILFQKQEQIIK